VGDSYTSLRQNRLIKAYFKVDGGGGGGDDDDDDDDADADEEEEEDYRCINT
jgi:hypothetical protein